MRTIAVVTTFSKAGWDQYGRRMVQTFDKFWPRHVVLYCYPDTKLPNEVKSDRVVYIYDKIKDKIKFFKRHAGHAGLAGMKDGKYNYRFDVLKFSHKPFALQDLAQRAPALGIGGMIWMDADIVTHSEVTPDALKKMAPINVDFAYLGRSYKYSECGFMFFNLEARGGSFLNSVLRFYRRDTFLRQQEWHDSWLFDQARIAIERQHGHGYDFHSYSPPHLGRRTGGGHPFVNSFLGHYMDHLKGDVRKRLGTHRPRDMQVNHPQQYWKR